MSTVRNMVRKVGGRFYTENLMSNPVQVRESVSMTTEQLNLFVRNLIDECLNMVDPADTDFKQKREQAKTNFGVL